MENQLHGKIFAKVPTKLKSALKLKLVLLLAKALTPLHPSGANTNDSTEEANWTMFKGFDGIYVITPNGKYYKIKLKLVLLLAKALASVDDSGEWRVFRGPDGIYTIAPNGKYYRINLNSNGELKLYRGKNRIYLGRRLNRGYCEASRSSSYSSDKD